MERWPSGRRRSPAKGVYLIRVSRVQIPASPPYFKKTAGLQQRNPAVFVLRTLPLSGRFPKAYSFAYVIKFPFDLLARVCGVATRVHTKSREDHDI